MLKHEKRKWRIILALVVGILLILSVASLLVQIYGYICTKDEYTGQKECSAYHIAPFIVLYVGEFLEAHNGAVVAIATCFIAWFTLTLKRSTDRLWESGKNALEVTERAFVYLDGFNHELTTALDSKIEPERLPERYRADPELYVTRFAVQLKWKNGGNTPVENMTICVNWQGPPAHIPPDYVYRSPPEPFFLAPKAVEQSAFIEIPEVQVLVDYGLVPVWKNYLVGDPWVHLGPRRL